MRLQWPRASPYFGEKNENHRRKKSRQGKQNKPPATLAQGLDPPMVCSVVDHEFRHPQTTLTML